MGVVERKEREFRRREEEILQAARGLFDDDAWQDVTIEDIAHRAEIGKGTVYLHFTSKEALYARLTLEFTRGLLQQVVEIDPALPVLDRLAEGLRRFLRHHAEHPEARRVLEYCWRQDFRSRAPRELQQEFDHIDDGFEAVLERDLREGVARGLLPAKPIRDLALSLRAALLGAVRLIWGECAQGGRPVDPQPFIEHLVRFTLAGLRFQDWAFAGVPEAVTPPSSSSRKGVRR